MALLTSELRRIRYELGYNVLNAGAEPYIGVTAIFDQVIGVYTQAGAVTTSSTTVAAASTPAVVTLVVASGTGITAGDRLIVDVDDRQEESTVVSVSGTSVVVHLSNAHTGTYPVTVEGGESIIREILRKLYMLSKTDGAFESAVSTTGIKKVDEVEFFGAGTGSMSKIEELKSLRNYWRGELASVLGVLNMNAMNHGGGSYELF